MTDSIDEVESIRRNNNTLWMDILRIALKTAPQETKKIIEQICYNDTLVTGHLLKLVKDEKC